MRNIEACKQVRLFGLRAVGSRARAPSRARKAVPARSSSSSWLPTAQLAAITRTSLGPNAMRKLVINHLEKLFVTSDAATIVQELEVAHPAARMLVQVREAEAAPFAAGVQRARARALPPRRRLATPRPCFSHRRRPRCRSRRSATAPTSSSPLRASCSPRPRCVGGSCMLSLSRARSAQGLFAAPAAPPLAPLFPFIVAQGLLKLGVHPAEIVDGEPARSLALSAAARPGRPSPRPLLRAPPAPPAGYKKASEKAYALLESLSTARIPDVRDRAALVSLLSPVIASKQGGYEALLAGLVADAVLGIMPPAPKPPSVNVDNVRVAKLLGGTVGDSAIVKGVVVQRGAEGAVKRVEKAVIAVFGCSIEAASTETRGTVVIKSAEELKSYNRSEEALMEETIRGVAEAGVNVVVVGGSISEIAMHYLEKFGILAVKVLSKFELRRLCRAVNATALVRVGAPTADECGFADVVAVQELSSRLVTVFRQSAEESAVATIVLRGATANALDDIERAIDDAVNTAKQACKDGRTVPGAGATEIELAARLADFAAATPGLEQYAIAKYAEALEVVPRVLAENSGRDPADVISALYAAHAAGAAAAGVDVNGDALTLDAAAHGVHDLLATKLSALRLASEAAITVLRIDTIIMSKQAGGPKPRAPQGDQAADD